MPTLLFDYGGTLDSDARHWNYVLRDGFTKATPITIQKISRMRVKNEA